MCSIPGEGCRSDNYHLATCMFQGQPQHPARKSAGGEKGAGRFWEQSRDAAENCLPSLPQAYAQGRKVSKDTPLGRESSCQLAVCQVPVATPKLRCSTSSASEDCGASNSGGCDSDRPSHNVSGLRVHSQPSSSSKTTLGHGGIPLPAAIRFLHISLARSAAIVIARDAG